MKPFGIVLLAVLGLLAVQTYQGGHAVSSTTAQSVPTVPLDEVMPVSEEKEVEPSDANAERDAYRKKQLENSLIHHSSCKCAHHR